MRAMEAVVAYLHFVTVLLLGMFLAAEYALCNEHLQPEHVRMLARIDLAYLACAGAVLVTGAVGVLAVGRSPWFHLANPLFWVKFVLFFCLILVAIHPSTRFIRWARALAQGQERIVSGGEIARVRRTIGFELAIVVAIPLIAAIVARGGAVRS